MNVSQTDALKTGLEVKEEAGTWSGSHWYDLWLCGVKVGITVGYGRALSQLKVAARCSGIDLDAALLAYVEAIEAQEIEAAPIVQSVEVVQVIAVEATAAKTAIARKETASKVQANKVPCCFYRSIRRFYAIAQDVGLSTSNDEAIRQAISAFFGIEIESRKQLSGGHWEAAGDAVKFGALYW
jgi:hypothetical protein